MIATREHLCRPNQSDKFHIEGKASPFWCWRVCDSNQQFTTVRLGEGNDSRVRVQGLQVLVRIERDFQSSAPSARGPASLVQIGGSRPVAGKTSHWRSGSTLQCEPPFRLFIRNSPGRGQSPLTETGRSAVHASSSRASR